MRKLPFFVPYSVTKTLTKGGYFREYYRIIEASGLSAKEAFEHIEEKRAFYEFPPKYTSWESFRAAKSRYMKIIRINSLP